MDNVGGGRVNGLLPMLNAKCPEQDGRANSFYIPRFQNLTRPHGRFIRGYSFNGAADQQIYERALPGFGSRFKQAVREHHPWTIHFGGAGESLARYENQVSLDPRVVDAWGIPVVHIDMAYGDNERRMVEDMGGRGAELLDAAGATDIRVSYGPLTTPGRMIHEVGTARMGQDSKKSVLDRFNQAWEVKNLFVTDGACFVSNPNQNPTLTMMALTARACDYIIEERRAGRL